MVQLYLKFDLMHVKQGEQTRTLKISSIDMSLLMTPHADCRFWWNKLKHLALCVSTS